MTTILVICTGNICRSPVAAAMLQRRLTDAHVTSAGLSTEGEPAHVHSIESAADLGLDLSGHRSRRLTADAVNEADLVLGMERAHVREAVLLAPPVWPRAFTLKELVRRMQNVGPRLPGDDLRTWLAEVHAGREKAMLLGADPADDVEDPIDRPRSVFDQTTAEMHACVDALVKYAWPDAQ